MYCLNFQVFQDIVPNIPIGDCASGHRDENRNKSRDIMLLPRKYGYAVETVCMKCSLHEMSKPVFWEKIRKILSICHLLN